jgi:hypothetical protein
VLAAVLLIDETDGRLRQPEHSSPDDRSSINAAIEKLLRS